MKSGNKQGFSVAIPSVLKDFLGHIKLPLISEVSYAARSSSDFNGIGAKSAQSRNNYSEYFAISYTGTVLKEAILRELAVFYGHCYYITSVHLQYWSDIHSIFKW